MLPVSRISELKFAYEKMVGPVRRGLVSLEKRQGFAPSGNNARVYRWSPCDEMFLGKPLVPDRSPWDFLAGRAFLGQGSAVAGISLAIALASSLSVLESRANPSISALAPMTLTAATGAANSAPQDQLKQVGGSPAYRAASGKKALSGRAPHVSTQNNSKPDNFARILSTSSLVLSAVTFVVTYMQRRADNERALRVQLTDAIGKLHNCLESSAKLGDERQRDYNEPRVVAMRAFYNTQKGFWAEQAIYFARKIKHLVSDAEYSVVARAFDESGDQEQALTYSKLAVELAGSDLKKAMSLRAYGLRLMRWGLVIDGRNATDESLRLVNGKSDHDKWFRAETLQRRAVVEAVLGEKQVAKDLFLKSKTEYESISLAPMRTQGLRNLQTQQNKSTPLLEDLLVDAGDQISE